jgi:DNA uptake protein ComE-like DNA-binding protein
MMTSLRALVGFVLLIGLILSPIAMTGSFAGPPRSPTDVLELLDINTASAEQLRAMAAIGDAYSEKIIKGISYVRKDELVEKKILTRAAYEQIKYQIVAK